MLTLSFIQSASQRIEYVDCTIVKMTFMQRIESLCGGGFANSVAFNLFPKTSLVRSPTSN